MTASAIKFTGNMPVGALRPNPWNTNIVSPENEKKLEASIKRFGMFKAVIVRELPGGVLEILGGQHRWEAARRLGYEEVPIINLGTVDEKTAKEIGLADNGRYGDDDSLALSELLKEIGVENVAEFMPYTDLDIANILSVDSISLDGLGLPDDVDSQGALPDSKSRPTHQIMRFKVPVEDTGWITALIEKTMKRQNFTAEDSLTNAGNGLVHLLKEHKE